jgi:hypothetical protein
VRKKEQQWEAVEKVGCSNTAEKLSRRLLGGGEGGGMKGKARSEACRVGKREAQLQLRRARAIWLEVDAGL